MPRVSARSRGGAAVSSVYSQGLNNELNETALGVLHDGLGSVEHGVDSKSEFCLRVPLSIEFCRHNEAPPHRQRSGLGRIANVRAVEGHGKQLTAVHQAFSLAGLSFAVARAHCGPLDLEAIELGLR